MQTTYLEALPVLECRQMPLAVAHISLSIELRCSLSARVGRKNNITHMQPFVSITYENTALNTHKDIRPFLSSACMKFEGTVNSLVAISVAILLPGGS